MIKKKVSMRKIAISVEPWETSAAILQDDRLQNIYFEAHTTKQLERAFYKGVVAKVLPGIQTVFVDIGQEKAGFLHISEIDRELAIGRMHEDDEFSEEEEKKPQYVPMDVGKILREGDQILVQVSKEPVYEKGAKLTTCFTLPGRFLVLLPNIPRIGISKKIDSREERVRLRTLVQANLPAGMGAIVRTSSASRTEAEIKQDLTYLSGVWQEINKAFEQAKPFDRVHQDLPLALAVVRDNIDDDVESVITNDKHTQQEIYKFLKTFAVEYTHKVQLCKEPPALFQRFNIDRQLDEVLEKKVQLKSGGSIIVESTEAMTVIDVNTGKYIGKSNKSNMEDTILQTNLEAAQEIVRQLRLRNIGGLIVIDFIDMGPISNRQKLFKYLEQTLRETDKYQSVVLRVSEFGLVQMTRKRSGKTLVQQLMERCSQCLGRGVVKSTRMLCNTILMDLKKYLLEHADAKNATLALNPAMFDYLTRIEYDAILSLEKQFSCVITLESRKGVALSAYNLSASA